MVKSPRWLRPHSIELISVLPEVNYEEQTSITKISQVKVEVSAGLSMGKTGKSNSDNAIVVIDMNDYRSNKKYNDNPETIKDFNKEFRLVAGDRIKYRGQEYEITSVKRVDPLRNAPEFIELICQ